MERTVPTLRNSVSDGMYLNVCVAGESVNGLMKGHFFHSKDLGWSHSRCCPAPSRLP